MQTTTPVIYYVIGAVVLLVIIAAAIVAARRANSARLAKRFGPEYERTLQRHGDDRAAAERELARREERVKRFHIEELPAGARTRYAEEWRTVQSRFVDEPRGAIDEADRLVTNVMRDRGYPVDNFEQQVNDISPDHPAVVENFRTAHAIASRSERGEVSTEDLRQAMVHYRALFDDLLGANKEQQR